LRTFGDQFQRCLKIELVGIVVSGSTGDDRLGILYFFRFWTHVNILTQPCAQLLARALRHIEEADSGPPAACYPGNHTSAGKRPGGTGQIQMHTPHGSTSERQKRLKPHTVFAQVTNNTAAVLQSAMGAGESYVSGQ
jgi:hypothetical protein